MARRNDSTVKAVIFLIFIIAVIFSLYSYQDVHSRLQKSEERGEKLTQQHDSFAAQVQGTSDGHILMIFHCIY